MIGGRALAAIVLAGAALLAPATAAAGAGTPSAPVAAHVAPQAAIPPSTLYVDRAFPTSKGTSAITKKVNRSLTLGKYLGDPAEGKHPAIEWWSRYTKVWRKPPEYRGFQSGAYNNRSMVISVTARCGEVQPPGGSGGGDWKDPLVFIGSGGGMMNTKRVAKLRSFPCDGKAHVIIRDSDWADVDAAYGQPFSAPYFDVLFPIDEVNMMIRAEDDTWLHGIVSAGPTVTAEDMTWLHSQEGLAVVH